VTEHTAVEAASPPSRGVELSRASASMPAAIVAASSARKPAKMHRAATCGAAQSHLRNPTGAVLWLCLAGSEGLLGTGTCAVLRRHHVVAFMVTQLQRCLRLLHLGPHCGVAPCSLIWRPKNT